MSQIILKPNPENLKNAIAAVVGRAVTSVKRFATALHNKCNLVVYVDWFGRTCCQFIKKDALTGYHFEFSGNICLITNKQTGDVYSVTYAPVLKSCTCPAYRYSPPPKQLCKHINMVAELKGDLEQAITPSRNAYAQVELNQYIEEQADSIALEIDLNNVPKGCRLERSDDWMSLEYYVHVWGYQRIRGIPTVLMKNIGRLVQYPDGIYAYTVASGIGRTFSSTTDAIAYLVRVVGTSFREIAQAFQARELTLKN